MTLLYILDTESKITALRNMDYIRQRLPAPRQAKLAKDARTAPVTDVQFEPSRISELATKAPAWYKSAARRRLYSLLFPAAVLSYMTSGYDGSMMNSLQVSSFHAEVLLYLFQICDQDLQVILSWKPAIMPHEFRFKSRYFYAN